MKTVCRPEAVIRFTANHGLIQDGAPRQRRAARGKSITFDSMLCSKKSVFVIEEAGGEVVAPGRGLYGPRGSEAPAGFPSAPSRNAAPPRDGTVAFFVTRQSSALDLAAVVIDAHEVRLKAHRPRQKSDRRDTYELCEGLCHGMYRTIIRVPHRQWHGCARPSLAAATSRATGSVLRVFAKNMGVGRRARIVLRACKSSVERQLHPAESDGSLPARVEGQGQSDGSGGRRRSHIYYR